MHPRGAGRQPALQSRPCGWALHRSSSPNLPRRSTSRTPIGLNLIPSTPRSSHRPPPKKGAERHSPGWGARVSLGGNTAAQRHQAQGHQPRRGVVRPDPTAAPPVENTSRAVRSPEVGGRRRDGERRREVLTRCKAGRCRPLPAAPGPEAGGGSAEPEGGCHAAPLPPPRLPAVTSAAPARPLPARVRGPAGTAPAWTARARALPLGAGTRPLGAERGPRRHRPARSQPIKTRRSSHLENHQ